MTTMTAAKKQNLVSVDEYLQGELKSSIKHEYLGGVVYAMAGSTNLHSVIALNVAGTFLARLRGRKCRPFGSDTKIRIRLPKQVRFYYSDAMVVCRPNSLKDLFQDEPVVICEVLSHSTRRVDEGEKKEAYFTIDSLGVYLLVEQEFAKVTAYRRGEHGFEAEVYEEMDAVIPLPEIDTELPLAEIYERVEFVPEAAEEDA